MRIIKITPVAKKRVKQMILGLFPGIGYARITSRGLAILKATRWSLKREIVPITDLCIYEIPKRIAEKASRKRLGENQIHVFNHHITTLMQLKYYNDKFDLLEYVYTQYAIVCMETPIVKTKEILAIESSCIEKSGQFHLLNIDYIYGVGNHARKAITKFQQNKVYQQIQKIKNSLPNMRKPEIKFPRISRVRYTWY